MNTLKAAVALGLSRATIMRRIALGKLRARRDGRRIVIEESEIERYKRQECQPMGLPPVPVHRPIPSPFKGMVAKRNGGSN